MIGQKIGPDSQSDDQNKGDDTVNGGVDEDARSILSSQGSHFYETCFSFNSTVNSK